MERLGAYKVVDWHCLRLAVPEKDERLEKLNDEIMEKYGFEVLDVAYLLKHDKKKLSEWIMKCLGVLDEAKACKAHLLFPEFFIRAAVPDARDSARKLTVLVRKEHFAGYGRGYRTYELFRP